MNETHTEAIGFDGLTGLPLSFGGTVYGYEFMLAIAGVAYGGDYAVQQEPDNDLYVRAVDFLNSYMRHRRGSHSGEGHQLRSALKRER